MPLKEFDTNTFELFIQDLILKDQRKNVSLQKNGIPFAEADPFSALFECAILGITTQEWLATYEARRIRQKTLQNHIGKLHEVAISCLPGWTLSSSTADVENSNLKVVAEIKNKHNTMNSSSALATYNKLEHLVDGVIQAHLGNPIQKLCQTAT